MDNDLQFDKAEFAAPRATTCSACKAALTTEYYAINGQVFCANCAEGVRRHFSADAQGRLFGRAVLMGLGAALLGSAAFAVAMIQRIPIWIIICAGIGWLVGKAVRKGSGNLGGTNYQILAAILTYLSICGAFGANLVHGSGFPSDASDLMNLVLAALTKPVTGGMNGIYGLAAVAFGIWEGWQLNRPVKLEITGPHGIGGTATGA
jgi:hypothetical protein